MRRFKKSFSRYTAVWKRLEGWKLFLFYLAHYTLLFLILQRLVFSDFYEAEKSFIWQVDGSYYYFPSLMRLSQTFRDGIQSLLNGEGWTIPLYDFRNSAIKTSLQVEPIQWLAVLCPWDKIDVFYDILTLLRYYLCGVTFSFLGFYFKQKPIAVMTGAVSYVFCGYALYVGEVHPQFLSLMIILPLLVIGAEKVVKGESAWLFTGLVFMSLMGSVYFSCIQAVIILIYIFTRYFCAYQKDGIRGFGRLLKSTLLWGGLGCALSGGVWLPMLLQMVGTGRIGHGFQVMLKYADSYYERCFTGFVVWSGYPPNWAFLGFSVLVLPMVLLLLFDKRKAAKTLKVIFFIFTGMVCLPMVGYVLSGFNAFNNRWIFAYALCVCVILTVELPQLPALEPRKLAAIGGGVTIYVMLCYFSIERAYYHEQPLVMLLLSCVLIGLCYCVGEWGKRVILPLSLIITCLSVSYSGFLLNDPTQGNEPAQFIDKGASYALLTGGQYDSVKQSGALEQDSSFFRVTGSDLSYSELNGGFYFGINGLSYVGELSFPSYARAQHEFETAYQVYNSGPGSTPPILSMFAVKYYAARQNTAAPWPYGFKEINQVRKGKFVDSILENQYALPIGYTYDSYSTMDSIKGLNGIQRQETALQSVIVENDSMAQLPQKDPEPTAVKVPVKIESADGVEWSNGHLRVTQEYATMTLTFQGTPGADTYLRVVNLDLTDGASSRHWELTASTEDTAARAFFTADGWTYTNGAKTQLFYFGNSAEGYTSCTLTFPQEGTFILDDLEIWCQPMDHYADQIEALRAEPLENVETNWRGLTGTVSVSRDKFLCLSIPYNEDWTAYVDGKKAELVQANIGFMGVELSAGDHEIELKYWPQGMTMGITLSCTGLLGVIGLVVYSKKKKQNSQKQ